MSSQSKESKRNDAPDKQQREQQHPVRTCVGCGQRQSQSELLRIASHLGAMPVLDLWHRLPGRGAYLCYDATCVERAWQRQALTRSLKLKLVAPEETSALVVLKEDILRALDKC